MWRISLITVFVSFSTVLHFFRLIIFFKYLGVADLAIAYFFFRVNKQVLFFGVATILIRERVIPIVGIGVGISQML